MRIDKLTLKNFRCFELLSLDLHPNLTLLVGENASGKTAVLEGLAAGLGAFFMGIPDAHTTSGSIDRSDVRTVFSDTEGVVALKPQYPCLVQCSGWVLPDHHIKWRRELRSPRARTTRQHAEYVKRSAMALLSRMERGEDLRLPVIAYYGTRRLWRMKKDTSAQRDMRSRFAGYWDCLDPASNQKHLVDWMRWQTYGALQEGQPSPHLEAIAAAVCACVLGLEKFFYDVKKETLTLQWRDGVRQPFDQLSDGYRNLVAMVADIAWRAVVLSPRDGVQAAANAVGVVLIDEVDLHLHPRWQLHVLDDLRRTFPGIQFVVTTHAASVVGTCPPASLRVLMGDGRVGNVSSARGLSANEVLVDVMGSHERLPEVKRLVEDIDDILDSDKPENAERKIEELAALLGNSNGAVVRARVGLAVERGDLDAIVDEK